MYLAVEMEQFERTLGFGRVGNLTMEMDYMGTQNSFLMSALGCCSSSPDTQIAVAHSSACDEDA